MNYLAWFAFALSVTRMLTTLFRPDGQIVAQYSTPARLGNAVYYIPTVVFFVWFIFLQV